MRDCLRLTDLEPANPSCVVVSKPAATLNVTGSTGCNERVALSDCGLIEIGPTLMPARFDLRRRWHDTISGVLADGESRFFPVHTREGFNVIGLSTDEQRVEVRAHLPRRTVCCRNAVHRVAVLVAATPRERDILECLADGTAPRDIAQMLGTRLSTVRSQIKSLLGKLDLRGTRELLLFLARLPEV